MSDNKDFIEGIDFNYSESGLIVFSKKYRLERGYCCGNGCVNCPYHYKNVPEPVRSKLLDAKQNKQPDF